MSQTHTRTHSRSLTAESAAGICARIVAGSPFVRADRKRVAQSTTEIYTFALIHRANSGRKLSPLCVGAKVRRARCTLQVRWWQRRRPRSLDPWPANSHYRRTLFAQGGSVNSADPITLSRRQLWAS